MKKIVSAPYIDQTARWVNGCESISSVMLLQAVGIPIDPDVFIERAAFPESQSVCSKAPSSWASPLFQKQLRWTPNSSQRRRFKRPA